MLDLVNKISGVFKMFSRNVCKKISMPYNVHCVSDQCFLC